ncbi:MAG: hypothetical protein ABI112_08705, partial [Terracoccus sp.]
GTSQPEPQVAEMVVPVGRSIIKSAHITLRGMEEQFRVIECAGHACRVAGGCALTLATLPLVALVAPKKNSSHPHHQ